MLRAGVLQTLAAFNVGLFRLHWALTVAAFMSFSMSFTVLQVVAFDLGGDNASVSIAMAGNGIAWFIVGPYAGALADRLPKRRLLVLAQSVIAANFALIGLLIVMDQIQVIWLTISSFLLGSCFAFTGPTRRAYVADIVPQRLVGNGVALLQTGLTFPMSVGPVIGSLLLAVAFIGPGGAYFIMAGLLVLTVAALFLMPSGAPRNVHRGAVIREILLGLRYAWREPRLRVLLVALMLISVAASPYQILLPGLLENELGLDAANLGLVTWPMGVGSFVVGLAVAGVVGTRWSGRVMFAMGAAFGLGVGLLGVTPNAFIMLIVVFVVGAGFSAFQTINTAEVIHQSDSQYHGRITSLTFLPFGVQAMSGLAMAQFADWIGERPVLVLMGLAAIAFSFFFGAVYLRMRSADLPPPAEMVRRVLRPAAAVMRPQKSLAPPG